jgi:hypothetical protein
MTEPNAMDASTARALDRFTVPSLPADFADRLVAQALAEPTVAPLPPVMPTRGAAARRSLWVRGRRAVIGVAAVSLMGAAAAATGVFGDAARNVPVIGPLIASVAPAPKPKPKLVAKPMRAKKPIEPEGAAALVVPDAPPIEVPGIGEAPIVRPVVRQAMRREIAAQRIVDRIEAREARGLPPISAEQRAKLIERLSAMPPGQRRALVKRIREIRQERSGGLPTGPAAVDDSQSTIGGLATPDVISDAAVPVLTPEQRRALRETRRLRWQQRQAEKAQQAEPNVPTNDVQAPEN